MKKRFGIDIDGTVTSPDSMIPMMNKAFQLNLSLEDLTSYDVTSIVNVSAEKFMQWFFENEAKIYQQSTIANDAKEILHKWNQQHELYYISARSIHLLEDTKLWFHEKDIPYDHIELIGHHNKVEHVKKYQLDIFFEDKHDNAVDIHEKCQIPVILFDTPYNRKPVPEGVIRVHSWKEAEAWVENWLKKEKINTVTS